MELSYNYLTGQPKEVAAAIARSMVAFKHYYKTVKVGVTGHPYQQSAVYATDHWRRMVVKYKTSSIRNADAMSDYFTLVRPELKNRWAGFSYLTEAGPYYVYILMK
ncbi:MAG: hypothetical protein K5867_04050 [Bacteroidales bacterium]|nr:hypothetical protein [Bacteroidales bacterium]